MLMKGGFICTYCRVTHRSKEAFATSDCIDGRCHRVTEAHFQCCNCYQLSNDIEAFKNSVCPKTRVQDPPALPREAHPQGPLPSLPEGPGNSQDHQNGPHSAKCEQRDEQNPAKTPMNENLKTPTKENSVAPTKENPMASTKDNPVAPTKDNPVAPKEDFAPALSPTHADNLALQLALQEAQAELEKLVILRSLESERERLRQLMLKKAEIERKTPMICV